MGSDLPVTPEEAVFSLTQALRYEPWFLTVGLGQEPGGTPALFVYVKSIKAAKMKQLRQWKGYKVHIKSFKPRPATRLSHSVKHPTDWLLGVVL